MHPTLRGLAALHLVRCASTDTHHEGLSAMLAGLRNACTVDADTIAAVLRC